MTRARGKSGAFGPELELSRAEMRRMIDLAADRAIEHIETLGEQPALDVDRSEAAARLATETAPVEGTAFDELLDRLFDELVPTSFNNPGPGFMAFIPGGGLYHAAVADYLADAVNRYVTVWAAAPGLVELETSVVRWFAEMVGFGAGSGGYLATGGSQANFSAVVAARRERLPERFLDGTLYASDQIHHSVTKAALLAGFPPRNVRLVPSDGRGRIRIGDLVERVRADREAGLEPFLVVGSAGTTNTGAVDDLEALATAAERFNLWLHVDAAYGGFFLLTERGRDRMRGIERADSVTLDPHKGLFLPYGTGCLLVRDLGTLERSHSVRADYMPPIQEDASRVDFCEISPELSRDFRGLRVWLPLKMHGLPAFGRELDEKLDLAGWAARELAGIEGIEVVDTPQLTVVPFRLEAPGLDGEAADRLNRKLIDGINARRRVFLTGTTFEGRFTLRICILNFRTHRDRVKLCLQDVRRTVAALV